MRSHALIQRRLLATGLAITGIIASAETPESLPAAFLNAVPSMQDKGRIGVIRLEGKFEDKDGDGKTRRKSKFTVEADLSAASRVKLVENPVSLSIAGREGKLYELSRTIVYNGEYWTSVVDRQGHPGELYD